MAEVEAKTKAAEEVLIAAQAEFKAKTEEEAWLRKEIEAKTKAAEEARVAAEAKAKSEEEARPFWLVHLHQWMLKQGRSII